MLRSEAQILLTTHMKKINAIWLSEVFHNAYTGGGKNDWIENAIMKMTYLPNLQL